MQPQAKSLGHLEHGGETWIAIAVTARKDDAAAADQAATAKVAVSVGTYQESCPLGVLELSTKLQGTAR